jgi:hypothetical protein
MQNRMLVKQINIDLNKINQLEELKDHIDSTPS